MEKVNLTRKFESFAETWVPKIVGELNGQFVKLAKFEGEYIWHQHESEDELFLVLKGEVTILAISHQPALFSAADRIYRLQAGKADELPVGEAPAAMRLG